MKNFGKLFATLTAEQAVNDEKKRVDEAFKAHFDKDNEDYLSSDYKDFVENHYPAFIKEKYPYLNTSSYPAKDRPAYGLALSGGGIRSASFAIGVIQALRNKNCTKAGHPTLFDKINYLSTSSGGGYAGAALTWFMRKYGIFPFGNVDENTGSKEAIAKENRVLNHIRQHGKYLTPPQLGLSGLIASVLTTALHSLIAYTLLLTLAFLVLLGFVHSDFIGNLFLNEVRNSSVITELLNKADSVYRSPEENINHPHRISFFLFFLTSLLVSTGLLVASIMTYALCSYFSKLFSRRYGFRLALQKWLATLLKVIGGSSILMALPVVVAYLLGAWMQLQDTASWAALGSGIGGVVASAMEFRRRTVAKDNGTGVVANLVNLITISLVIFFLLVVSFNLAEMVFHIRTLEEADRPFGLSMTWYVIAAMIVIFAVNINQIGLHQLYRDRLLDTFLKDPDTHYYQSLARRGAAANASKLQDLAIGKKWSPYHLINSNIILSSSRIPRYQGRLGDNFILSPWYCGSDSTGYVSTDKFNLGSLTLPTAVAISGAATNPHAGVSGIGLTTSPISSFLMTVLGLRLGYWAANPRYHKFKFVIKANYYLPGIFNLLNFGHTEKTSFIELSDGGHFDNTGLYELIRRRLPIIILSDGTADGESKFDDLGNAIERARVDFGVDIRFCNEDDDLTGLIPGSLALDDKGYRIEFHNRFQLAKRGYAIADVFYPKTNDSDDAFVGRLIYIKATLTEGVSADVYSYKANNPFFPNQPTSDQFFDERQFEAYRQLGYTLTKRFLTDRYYQTNATSTNGAYRDFP